MQRIKLLTEETANGEAKEILNDFKQKMGKVINIFKVMANSSAALKTYLGITRALKSSTISEDIQERIALRLAAINRCEYCNSAHSYLASKVLSEDEIKSSRDGKSSDVKAQAALKFAEAVMKKAGKINYEEFDIAKKAGFSDGELLEIVSIVTLNFFTNAINNVSHTEVDFPKPKI